MKKIAVFILFCSFFFFAASVFANPVEIKWLDLAPVGDSPQEKLYQTFSEEDQGLIEYLLYMEMTKPEIIDENDADLVEELAKEREKMEKRGVNLSAFAAAREKSMTRINTELDGKEIRLAGYLLPLEAVSGRIREFLLVPYVGACIHVPPPPPNQIIYATVAETVQDLPESLNEFFAPVYVTGFLSAKKISKDLFLVDGNDTIEMGYMIVVKKIEKYSDFSKNNG